MMWTGLIMAAAQAQLASIERDRELCRHMTPKEREAFYAKKEESRRQWEAEQSRKAQEAALVAEQEEIANRTYRNKESDFYDPLRVAKERMGIKP